MHVASVCTFAGEAPTEAELLEHIGARMHLVPRYRQRLAEVPLGQGRPVWVDDPHFNLAYHVRASALPAPGDDARLQELAGRLFALPLDRSRPLWEMVLVEGLAPADDGEERFAVITKTHHALVDGVSGVDVTAILFDAEPHPDVPAEPAPAWAPAPSSASLLADALLERATVPAEGARAVRALTRRPRQAVEKLAAAAADAAAFALPARSAPPSPLNVDIGPHRRYAWVDAEVAELKAVKDALGGTLNDAVLTAVSIALGTFLRGRGFDTTGLVLRAMVPVSVRATDQEGSLGNRVAAMWAPLPVDEADPVVVHETVVEAMRSLKESGQAIGATHLTGLADFAPPTILSQAARLQARQRFFNVVVTNVPGPQVPLYLLGRRLEHLYPVVPLGRRLALGIAVMSYNGRMGFGLLADRDALPDLADAVDALRDALDALADRAAAEASPRPAAPAEAPARRPAARTSG